MEERNASLWVASLGGVPTGYAHCRVERIEGKRRKESGFLRLLYVPADPDMGQSKIAVAPAYRRKGVATRLIQDTLEYFAQEGVEIAIVYVYSDNAVAQALLSKLGFSHSERFYYEPFSDREPFVFDTVFAELDLRRPLKRIRLNPNVKIRTPCEDDLEAMVEIFGRCAPWVFGPSPSAD